MDASFIQDNSLTPGSFSSSINESSIDNPRPKTAKMNKANKNLVKKAQQKAQARTKDLIDEEKTGILNQGDATI